MKNPKKPAEIAGVRNITISGRIGTGKSTLAVHLAQALGWQVLDGGTIFRKYAREKGFHITQKEKIPDKFDRDFEDLTKKILKEEDNHIVQSHLAGFVAQGIKGVLKVLVVCEDEGEDKKSIRIDRLMNRDLISAKDAKEEATEREERLLAKFKKLYVNNDPNWVYWDRKYYDLVVNTFNLNQKDALNYVLKGLSINVY